MPHLSFCILYCAPVGARATSHMNFDCNYSADERRGPGGRRVENGCDQTRERVAHAADQPQTRVPAPRRRSFTPPRPFLNRRPRGPNAQSEETRHGARRAARCRATNGPTRQTRAPHRVVSQRASQSDACLSLRTASSRRAPPPANAGGPASTMDRATSCCRLETTAVVPAGSAGPQWR
jgi:hypothetical protein